MTCVIHTFPKGWTGPDPYDDSDDRESSPLCTVCGVQVCGSLLHGSCKRTKGHKGRHTWHEADVFREEQREPTAKQTHSPCSGCKRHTLTASMPHGRCAACDETFDAGVEAAIAAMVTDEAIEVARERRSAVGDGLRALAEHVRRTVKR